MQNDLLLLEKSLEQSHNAIAIADMNGYNIFINDAWAKMHGYSASELLGTHMSIFHTQEQFSDEVEPFIAEVIKTGHHEGEDIHIKKDGSLLHTWMMVNVVKDKDGKPLAIVGACRDMTERRQTKDSLEKEKQQADTENQEKSMFLANMSHELRTPLNVILGFTQLLVSDKGLTGKQTEFLNIIQNNGDHLLTLINNIIRISKIESGHVKLNEEEFNLSLLLDDLDDMFRLKVATKGISLNFELDKAISKNILSDEQKLRQILINLINNAITATQKGGVTVRVKESERVITKGKTGAFYLNLEVADTGCGISPEHLNSIFKPFKTIETHKNPQDGTGLGLAISRSFIRLLGGKVNISSAINHGSTFTFDIKINSDLRTSVEKIEPHSDIHIELEPNQKIYKVLIADGVTANRQLLLAILGKYNFKTCKATNANETINTSREWQPDLIFMNMDIVSSYKEAQCIKNNPHNPPPIIIAITATAVDEEPEKILAAECDDIIRSPLRERDIAVAMSKHLGIRFIYEDE